MVSDGTRGTLLSGNRTKIHCNPWRRSRNSAMVALETWGRQPSLASALPRAWLSWHATSLRAHRRFNASCWTPLPATTGRVPPRTGAGRCAWRLSGMPRGRFPTWGNTSSQKSPQALSWRFLGPAADAMPWMPRLWRRQNREFHEVVFSIRKTAALPWF